MTSPAQKVVIYRRGQSGTRSKTAAQYAEEWRVRQDPEAYHRCEACGRMVKHGKEGNLKKHYASPKDKIHCRFGVDKQS